MSWKTNPKIWLVASVVLFGAVGTALGQIIYVDADSTGANDGSSWANAYNHLKDALAAGAGGDEIWVAEGTYKPDEDIGHPEGSGEQNATFQLISGVAIYGSYAGFGEPDPNTRDAEAYETILSGDLNGDDSEVSDPVEMLYDLARSENSFYVVLGSGADESALLDGFVITGGNGAEGGGMLNLAGSPTVKDCTFRFNMAWGGGGMCNRDGSQPTLIDCTFSGNLASIGFGGAIGNYGSAPTLIDCIFEGNVAGSEGGAIHNGESSPSLINCVFSGNTAGADGGAVWNWLGSPMLVNCTFTGNSADRGGAIWNNNCGAVLSNCLFGGNTAVRYGGGLCRAGGTRSPTLANCTFSGNSASKKGGGICNWDSGDKAVLQNCVLWGNTDENGMDESSQIDSGIVNYCCIQGWTGALGGIGNIGGDPLLFDAANHDYHLLPRSACIDVGDNSRVPADMTDLDGDGNTTEPIPWDLDGNARIVDGDNDGNSVVDMGAYEANYVEVQMKFTPQAVNPGSQGKWFKLHFVLPERYGVEDVDVNKPALCKLMDTNGVAESNDMSVFVNKEDLVEVEASFDRGAFSLCRNWQAERTVTVLGMLAGTGGQDLYSTDAIKIINRTWENLAGLTSQWLEGGCGEPDWCGGQDINKDGAVNFADLALFDGCCIEIFAE